MAKFNLRLFIFLVPFFIVSALELGVWPINRFTFRFYETLNVCALTRLLPGPYYPDIDASMMEQGDLGYYTPLARSRWVRWVTDRRGCRFDPSLFNPAEANTVLVGDSLVVGSGLTQPDMLHEVLWRSARIAAYPYAPLSMEEFLSDPRFLAHPPKTVVLVAMERLLKDIADPGRDNPQPRGDRYWPVLRGPDILVDRLIRANLLRFVRASLRRGLRRVFRPAGIETHPNVFVSKDPAMLFFNDDKGPHPDDTASRITDRLVHYRDLLAKRGIRLIVMPVPNKSTIYYREAGLESPPSFLRDVSKEARRRGIDLLDLETPMAQAVRPGQPLLFQSDDTHWSRDGVLIAARLLESRL